MFVFQAMLFAGVGSACLLSGQGLPVIVFACFAFSFSAYWLIMSKGRLQICENGIWQYHNLLRWERIESYQFKGETDATLVLQTKAILPMLGRGALPVSVDQKDAIDELLKRRVQ